ncbi:MAG: hypothetical protein ACU0CY_13650 [Maritimibacter harenae]|jgi:UPF0716 family protein affecting phage T7 exclusion|uniref:hypothetical protein n=1 Tax=Maritimibacter harenae TaxID=2606218 RepID=UPI0019295A47|nr:hypothetical protein [Maritimibacter harenae]
MIVIAFAIFGALLGAYQARKRGGQRLDLAQYATAYGLAFAILGLFVTVFLSRGL